LHGMLGSKDVKKMIHKEFENAYNIQIKDSNLNPEKIHASEASSCTRLAYYERKNPLPPDSNTAFSVLMKDNIRRLFGNITSEYKVDTLSILTSADMIVDKEYVVKFEIIGKLPATPHPRDLLYLNACLFAFDKVDGILIYTTIDGETVEFSLTRNNRMLQEIVRRAKILSTLLKEDRVPIVEPSELCLSCKYYERCYAQERKNSSLGFLGLGKNG
jgi:CRISPR-associated exonuclease Cas4